MTVTFLFGSREALTGRSESFKKSVRRYLEAQGYAQTRDSFVEGSQEDMVFGHPNEGRKTYVEVKADSLGLKTKPLGVSLVQYFRQWQQQPEKERFTFWLFVQEVKLPTGAWQSFFGANRKAVDDWVAWYNTKCREEEELELVQDEVAEFRAFLRDSQVTVGSNVLLDLAT